MRTAICAALVLSVSGAMAAAEPMTRTVYVTVTDGQDAPVPGLTAADFTVKEGGKEREIVKVEPATATMHLALVVEERLIADGGVRMGLFEFMKRVNQSAEISLITVGLRNQTLVDYTSSPDALVDALNRLSLNPNPNSNMTEGIREAAKAIEADHAERPVMVVVAISGGQAGGAPSKDVLDAVRQSRVVMHSVTLAGGDTNNGDVSSLGDASNREHVLGDGPKQSGGRRLEIVTTSATQKALQQVAGDLLAQYAITYTLPDGVKPEKRFSASLKRKGASLRAPNVIADR
jgi:VWFA-related protein